MQQEGLQAPVRKRFERATMSDHDQPVAPNLLAQELKADHPNQRWVGDTTELVTGDGNSSSLSTWTCSRGSSSAGRSRR
jgi:transposase InsO family protein